MFFSLRPPSAVLSDANAGLIQLYEVVRDDPDGIVEILKFHQERHSREHYYSVRRHVPAQKIERAARMLYLNRTCWNGLYRVNRKGEFNVPMGTKTRVVMDDDFVEISNTLQHAVLRCSDFSETMRDASLGDVIYADPPYTVRHNYNGFLKYNEEIFSWDDQVRLRDEALDAVARGATVIISNADHDSLHYLYSGVAEFQRIARASVISGKSNARGPVTEAIFVMRPLSCPRQDA